MPSPLGICVACVLRSPLPGHPQPSAKGVRLFGGASWLELGLLLPADAEDDAPGFSAALHGYKNQGGFC
ncbi:hypothetical protein EUGRSUZ_B03748 [Eucalyptus grandis]|uniref:Uncharacterized protein n=2 Tax=Eucalyptus grandis TaxID=71139 RepID=A0ACC3LXL9_EUCGR|nr:hypothetical protein EUGRSUZ_B03748 [Eucalyptus grandis]